MNWLNLEIRTLRSPTYMGSDPVERATWLNLLAHCCEQENGGRIAGAALWKDRQWQQMCGVTAREVARATRLVSIEAEDVLVWGYDLNKEAEVQHMREIGKSKSDRKSAASRVNGQNGGRPKTQRKTENNPTENPTKENLDNPTETHRKEVEGERKGKELEKEEEKENGPLASAKADGKKRKSNAVSEELESEKSEHAQFIAEWMAYFSARTGQRYPFQPRDAKAVKILLKHFEKELGEGTPKEKAKRFIKAVHAAKKRTSGRFPFSAVDTLYDLANGIARLQAALSDTAGKNGAAHSQEGITYTETL